MPSDKTPDDAETPKGKKMAPKTPRTAKPAAKKTRTAKPAGTTGTEGGEALGTQADHADAQKDLSDSFTKLMIPLFADRLNQAIDRRPDVIRKGRGRVNDFCDRFDLHYTTAHRMLSGEALPDAALLFKLHKFFGINGMWFLGEGESDIDAEIAKSNVNIEVYNPLSNAPQYVGVPGSIIPAGLDTGRIVFGLMESFGKPLLGVVARVQADPVNEEIHLLHMPNNTLEVRRLMIRRTDKVESILSVSPKTGDTMTLHPDQLDFGERIHPERITVLGPVLIWLATGEYRFV